MSLGTPENRQPDQAIDSSDLLKEVAEGANLKETAETANEVRANLESGMKTLKTRQAIKDSAARVAEAHGKSTEEVMAMINLDKIDTYFADPENEFGSYSEMKNPAAYSKINHMLSMLGLENKGSGKPDRGAVISAQKMVNKDRVARGLKKIPVDGAFGPKSWDALGDYSVAQRTVLKNQTAGQENQAYLDSFAGDEQRSEFDTTPTKAATDQAYLDSFTGGGDAISEFDTAAYQSDGKGPRPAYGAAHASVNSQAAIEGDATADSLADAGSVEADLSGEVTRPQKVKIMMAAFKRYVREMPAGTDLGKKNPFHLEGNGTVEVNDGTWEDTGFDQFDGDSFTLAEKKKAIAEANAWFNTEGLEANRDFQKGQLESSVVTEIEGNPRLGAQAELKYGTALYVGDKKVGSLANLGMDKEEKQQFVANLNEGPVANVFANVDASTYL